MEKILFITHAGNPGGAELKMINLCSLIENPAEVLIFQNGSLEDHLKAKNIPYSVINMPSNLANVKRQNNILSLFSALPGIFNMICRAKAHAKNHDVLVCMSQKSFVLMVLANIFARKPIIWFMNDILSPEHFSRHMIFLLTKIFACGATHVVLNSQASLEAWKKSGGRAHDVSILYSAIDVESFDAQAAEREKIDAYRQQYAPNGKKLLGIFGRICDWKGQDIFLKALAAQGDDVHGVIVGGAQFGEKDYEDGLKALAKDLGIADRVTFAGHQSDIAQIMCACDVIVHCSTAPEPFGRVIVEAMLAKKPVIASNAGGAKEIVIHHQTGQLTEIGNVDDLAQAIQRYLSAPDWAAEIALNGREHAVKNFSNEATKLCFPKIIDQVL